MEIFEQSEEQPTRVKSFVKRIDLAKDFDLTWFGLTPWFFTWTSLITYLGILNITNKKWKK